VGGSDSTCAGTPGTIGAHPSSNNQVPDGFDVQISGDGRYGRVGRLPRVDDTAVHRFAVRRAAAVIADEVVSGTFLIAWRRLADVPPDAERPWLIATARWVMTNELRTQIRQRRLADRLAAEPAQHRSDPAETVATVDLVRTALATLRLGDQEVLRLTEWDQLAAADCAYILGCSTATFTVRLHRRARRRRSR